MDVQKAIRERRSIRAYAPREVEEDKLERVLDAGRLSPSASNRQERRFVIIRDKDTRKMLAEAAKNQRFVGEAPVVIAACSVEKDYIMSCGQFAYPIDTAIAVDHMTLAAVEEGLGTCWIGAFDEKKVKEILNIPDDIRVVSLLPLGYASEIPDPKPRKTLDEIVMWEKWGESLPQEPDACEMKTPYDHKNMFKALENPLRRKIVKSIGISGKTKKEIMDELGISESQLKFQLDFLLKECYAQMEGDKYRLNAKGLKELLANIK